MLRMRASSNNMRISNPPYKYAQEAKHIIVFSVPEADEVFLWERRIPGMFRLRLARRSARI